MSLGIEFNPLNVSTNTIETVFRVAFRWRRCYQSETGITTQGDYRNCHRSADLKDQIFYPVAIALAIGMVLISLIEGWSQPKCGPFGGANGPADYSLIILSGGDLCRMEANFGYELDLVDDVLTIEAEEGAAQSDVQDNAHFRLGPDLETAYAGHKVRLSFTIKPSRDFGAQAFEFNYSAGNPGDTGWTRIELKPEWDTYTAEIEVPRRLIENEVAFDYLAIRPVVPEKTRSIDLREIRFRRLGQW